MFAKIARPSSTAATIVAKLSSASTMSAASLRDVGAGDPHRDADVGRLQRRRVVHAVAGHRHDRAAAAAARCTMRSLCSGIDARVDRDLAHRARPARRRSAARELGAGDGAAVARRCRAPRAMTAAVRGWSPVIISGRMPASAPARPPPSPRRAAGRSSRSVRRRRDRCSSRSCGTVAALRAGASVGSRRAATPSVRSASPGERLVRAPDLLAPLGRQRHARCVADELAGAAREQHVRRALGEHDARGPRARRRDARAHQLALRRERHLADARQARVERLRAQPRLARRDEQRALGRIALHRPAPVALPHRGVVRAIGRARARARARRASVAVDRAAVRRGAPRPRARSRSPLKRHAPAGRDDRRAPSSRSSSACPSCRDAITLAEPSVSTAARWRTIALRRAMRCTPSESTAVTTAGSPSGHRRDGERHAEDQHVDERRRVPRMSSTSDDRHDHHDGDHDDDGAEQLAGAIELALQRRRLRRRVCAAAGDAPHLRLHPGRGHDRRAAPVGRRRSAEHHVVRSPSAASAAHGRRVLGHRQALAGERRLRRLQRRRLDQARVGGDRVALLDEDDVARHELGRGHALSLAVADARSPRRPTSRAAPRPPLRRAPPARSPSSR